MPKISYRLKNFSAERLTKIEQANAIITEYQQKGYELTLRQLYYQFVSRDLIKNNMREYKNLGDVINDARLAGLVDWLAIVDLTRELEDLSHWSSPSSIIDACASQYRIDKWATQPHRVEVWIEKDAVSNIVGPTCRKLDVPFFSCRGYTSQSEMWKAAQRLKGHYKAKQAPIILHLGDHDPSGKDMTRDVTDRLVEFSGVPVSVKRLALNMDQIELYNPPPNPAKITDSRAAGYIAEFGDESWELDALTPEVMSALIEDNVKIFRDDAAWTKAQAEEDRQKTDLRAVADHWPEVVKWLK